MKTMEWRGLIGRAHQKMGGIWLFVTPHGSVIEMGLAWLGADLKPLEGEKRKEAAKLIHDARRLRGKAFA